MGDVVPLFGASNGLAKNKKKYKYIVALDGRQLMIELLCNNQPKTGFRDGGGYEGEVWRARGAGDALHHHFGGIISCF